MKIYILTTDRSGEGRLISAHPTRDSAVERLFAYMDKHIKEMELRPEDVPARTSSDWAAAWEYIFDWDDYAWIDEVDLSGAMPISLVDWAVADGDPNADARPWTGKIRTEEAGIWLDLDKPGYSNDRPHGVWIEVSSTDGAQHLCVHAYSPEVEEPVNVRVYPAAITIDSDRPDWPGEQIVGRPTYGQLYDFALSVAGGETADDVFEDLETDEDGVREYNGVSVEDVEELLAEMGDDTLCEIRTEWYDAVDAARQLLGSTEV